MYISKLLHKRHSLYRKIAFSVALFPLVLIIVGIPISFILDGVEVATQEFLEVAPALLGTSIFILIIAICPIIGARAIQEKAIYMDDCFQGLSKNNQKLTEEEAKATFQGMLTLVKIKYGEVCFLGTGICPQIQLNLTYPVILPYDKITDVIVYKLKSEKMFKAKTTVSAALNVASLFTPMGGASINYIHHVMSISDDNGNRYDIMCKTSSIDDIETAMAQHAPYARIYTQLI